METKAVSRRFLEMDAMAISLSGTAEALLVLYSVLRRPVLTSTESVPGL